MKQATITLLNELNARFYAQHAASFSATRARPWPGLIRALASTPALESASADHGKVLDIGCGNGRAVPALHAHYGDALRYLGLDASEPLLAIARERWAARQRTFACADFVTTAAEHALPAERYALVSLLGVLHCVPSERARRELLLAAGTRLAVGGALIATIWRYDCDPRFAERCIPVARYPELARGLDVDDLEPGDRLLSFGDDPRAVRYAHFPSEAELTRLTTDLGPTLRARFLADGAGQQLNEYLVFGADAPSK